MFLICAVGPVCASISIIFYWFLGLWFPTLCASGAEGNVFVLLIFYGKCHKHQLYECIVFVGQFGGRGRMYTMHFQSTARDPPPSSFIRLLPLFCCEVVYLLLDLLQTLCGF